MIDNMDKTYIKNAVKIVKEFAKSKGYKIVFRNVTTYCGDFCFFIYKPGFEGYSTKYLVGYDGDWDAEEYDNRYFDRCIEAIYDFILKDSKNN